VPVGTKDILDLRIANSNLFFFFEYYHW